MRNKNAVKLSAPVAFNFHRTVILSGLLFFLLVIVYTFLSIRYSHYFENLLYGNDFWFGGDLSRHIYWTIDPDKSFRSHLHPVSFLLFKGLGWLLNSLNNLPEKLQIPVITIPIIVYTSIFMVMSTKLIVSLTKFPVWIHVAVIAAFVFIGPTLVFAPVPESHVLGGVSLLMQATLIWLWMQQEGNSQSNFDDLEKKGIVGGIIIFAFLATGFTLSNLMPAIIMMLAIPVFRRTLIKIAIAVGVFLVLLLIIHKFIFNFPFITRSVSNIMKETAWLMLPHFNSIILSFKNLLLAQFGLSIIPELQVWTSDSGIEYYIEQSGPSIFQGIAFIFWVGGIIWYTFRNEKRSYPNLTFFVFCALSLLSIIGFHSFYATGESFIFSAHAWPYVVLPGVITIRNSFLKKDYGLIIILLTAVALSMVQMTIGLDMLLKIQLPQV
ncbi:hypothetical protein BH23BAC1_BH23BAC1_32810 [soil metagenome]